MPECVYWHRLEERVLAPARCIVALFACPPPTGPGSISLPSFIAHVINRTQLPEEVLAGALVILHRLHARNPRDKGTSGHRLFLAAFMVAHKQLSDSCFSNETWRSVGKVIPGVDLYQINRMERELLNYVHWDILIGAEDLKRVEKELFDHYTIHYYPSPPLTPVALPTTRRVVVASPSSPSPSISSSLSLDSLFSLNSSSTTSSGSYFPSPRTPSTPFSPYSPATSTLSKVVSVFRSHLAPVRLASSTESTYPYSKDLVDDSSMDEITSACTTAREEEERPRRRRQNAGGKF